MDTVRISVILPVFGVEAYIGDCIASLKAQSQEGLEFIFVDDCSPDRSMAQVEAFAATDPRVRMIRMPENAGPGAARNRGIEAARGQYLSFIDPDDWVDPWFYSLLWAGAVAHPDCDIIKGKTVGIRTDTGTRVLWPERFSGLIAYQQSQGIPLYRTSFYDHYSALYRASLFADPTLRYGVSRVGEDTTFLLRICLKTQKIAFINDALYYYRCARSDSISQSWTEQRLLDDLQSLKEKIAVLQAHGLDEDACLYIQQRLVSFTAKYCFVTVKTPGVQAYEDRFSSHLRALASSLPNRDVLMKGSTEIRLLLQYGALIPISLNYLQCQRIRRWTCFLVTHPDVAGAYAEDYAAMLLQSIRMYWGDHKCDLRREGLFATIMPQWRSLPFPFRMKVLLLSIGLILQKGLKWFRKKLGGNEVCSDYAENDLRRENT